MASRLGGFDALGYGGQPDGAAQVDATSSSVKEQRKWWPCRAQMLELSMGAAGGSGAAPGPVGSVWPDAPNV